MKYLFLLITLFLFGCEGRKVRLINKNGKVINTENRIPIYNKDILEKKPENDKNHKEVISNYKTEEDGSGGKYFSTGRIETPIVPKDFQKIESLAPVYKKNNKVVKKNEDKQQNNFVPISEINFNENKNTEYTKKILLDKQNMITKSEYKPEKKTNVPLPKQNTLKNITEKSTKPQPPVEIKDSLDETYFIRVMESKSIIDITDEIKDVRDISNNNSISIEQNKRTGNHQLIVGPISKNHDAHQILDKMKKQGYTNAIITS